MLILLYLRDDPRAGLDLDLIVAGVFTNEPIQVFWFDPDGIANLNGRKFSLLDEFVDKSFTAVQDHCDLWGFKQFGNGLVGGFVHDLLLIRNIGETNS